MKKIVFTYILFATSSVFSQSQQGYVKTLGRPHQKGMPLSGVTIQLKGEHNRVLSGKNGMFTLLMPNKKPGEGYALQQVYKQGYELKDKETVGRQYAYSTEVPLTLVMVSRSEYLKEKQRIENNIYATIQKRYKNETKQLQQQLAANIISDERCRKQLQQLRDGFEKIQEMVGGLSEHYALVDYDQFDDRERQINLAIEQGELEQADSLLRQLGIQQRIADIAHQLETGRRLRAEAQQDLERVLRQQEKDAEYLYQLYTIALARFDNDKARFYITTRAELDTTNVEWQNQAVEYLGEYGYGLSETLKYANRSLAINLSNNGEYSVGMAKAYNLIGSVYYNHGQYIEASKNYENALRIINKLPDCPIELFIDMQLCLASTYQALQEMARAKERYDIATASRNQMRKLCEEALDSCQNNPLVSHNMKGGCYYFMALVWIADAHRYAPGDPLAKDPLQKAQMFFQSAIGEWEYNKTVNAGKIATTYMMMASIPHYLLNIIGKKEQYEKALPLLTKVYGTVHPIVATCIQSLGACYGDMNNREKAADLYHQAYQIRLQTLGESNVDTKKSFYEWQRSQQILQKKVPVHLIPANIVSKYFKDKNYEHATRDFTASQDYLFEVNDENFLLPIELYENWARIANKEKDYETEAECAEQMLELRRASKDYPPEEQHYKMCLEAYLKVKDMHKYLCCFYDVLLEHDITDREALDKIKEMSIEYIKENPNDQEVIKRYNDVKQKYSL